MHSSASTNSRSSTFLQAQQGFLRAGQLRDYALVTPDLVEMYIRRGDATKVRKTLERVSTALARDSRFCVQR